MTHENHIKDLLDQFRKETIEKESLEQLFQVINDSPESICQIIDNSWVEMPPHTGSDVDSQLLLNQINSKINITAKKHKSGLIRNFVIKSLPYAAVLLFGFLLSWFFFAKNTPNSSYEHVPNNTHFFKVKVEYGSKSVIELPDGSIVNLNSGSSISYPANFADDSRTVILEGEGYFDIRKDPSKPFYVKTRDLTVKVLGTKFNVKSYPDEDIVEATLVSGKVEIIGNNDKLKNLDEDHPLVLVPDQKAVFYRDNTNYEKENPKNEQSTEKVMTAIPVKDAIVVENKVKTEVITSWRNNILIFSSEPFSEIVRKLERWYNVEININNKKLPNVIFSGKFDKESIQEVLNALQLIEPFKYEISKNKVNIE